MVTELSVEVSGGSCPIGRDKIDSRWRSGTEEKDQRQDASSNEHTVPGSTVLQTQWDTNQPLLIVQTRTEFLEMVRIEL